jgi:hypothetical protein
LVRRRPVLGRVPKIIMLYQALFILALLETAAFATMTLTPLAITVVMPAIISIRIIVIHIQRWVIAIKTKIQLPNTLPIILNCVIGIIN